MKKLRIFVASPGDVAAERKVLEDVAKSLKRTADNYGLVIELLDWRSVVPDAGRPQQIIFDQLKPNSWDIFVGIVWQRFGTPSGAKDPITHEDYKSGTEEEFRTAYGIWKAYGKPRIVMYQGKKQLSPDLDLDQYKLVKDFFKEIQDANSDFSALTQSFDSLEKFEELWRDNLQQLLIDNAVKNKAHGEIENEETPNPKKIISNLPPRSDFFGRETEKEKILQALKPTNHTWGIYLDGMGGIGKTSLAIEVAHIALEQKMFEACVFVTAKQYELKTDGIIDTTPTSQGLDDFLSEAARVLEQKGIAQLAANEKQAALLEYLKKIKALLIYDNLESLSEEGRKAVEDFFRKLPRNCKAIITSRARSNHSEVELRIKEIDWEAAKGIIETKMNLNDRLSDKLKPVELRWKELHEKTKGSPLILLHILGLMRVRSRLDFNAALALLDSVQGDDDMVQFLFKEARKELSTNDEDALRSLSFFVPSASFEAWAEVSGLSKEELEKTLDHLDALSLIEIQGDRYSLHPLTRTYIQTEFLRDNSVAYETGLRFAQYWLEYAEQYGGIGENYKTFYLLEAEWSNLKAIANWLWKVSEVNEKKVTNKDTALLLCKLNDTLRQFLLFSGLWDEKIQITSRVYEAMYVLKEWSRAGWGANDTAFTYKNRGQTDKATVWAEKCDNAFVKGQNKRDIAAGKQIRGKIAQQKKEYTEAETLFKEALKIYRDLRKDADVSIILNDLGLTMRSQNKYNEAEAYFKEGLEIAKKLQHKEFMASRMCNLSLLELDRENWQAAYQWLGQAFHLAKEVGRQDLIAWIYFGFAKIHEEESKYDLALPAALEALKIRERLQDRDLDLTRALVERLQQKIAEKNKGA